MDLKTETETADLIQRGRAFHKLVAATEKARSPLHFSKAQFILLHRTYAVSSVLIYTSAYKGRVPWQINIVCRGQLLMYNAM